MDQHIVEEIMNMAQFRKIILNSLSDNKLIIIDFFADWCNPCKAIAPYIEELATKFTNIHFFKINTDNAELKDVCSTCEIKGIPAFCYFHNGKYIDSVVGADKNAIMKNIEKYQTF